MKTLHLAVVTGIGITIIVAITVLIMFVINPAPHAEITIEGLRNKYSVGEKLDFVVAARGYGSYCNGPLVEIYNAANQSHLIWGGSYMQYTGMYCNPHDFDYVFHVGEPSQYSLSDKVPIILDKPGVYLVKVRLPHLTTSYSEQEFSVIQNVSNIIIPNGTEDQASGKNYEPRYLVVVLGVNNTVRWINESPIPAPYVVAASHDDPLFWNATHSPNNMMLFPGKSFNFTFTKAGEFQYDTVMHSWMYGWILALPQSSENAIQTVTLNTSSGIPDPCETFRLPCPFHPNNYNFTAQRFGSDIYIEKFTINGVDNYAIIKPDKTCYYPPTYSNSCINPDDLAILRLVGVDTSIPQEDVHVSISGLGPFYSIGQPVDFGITIKGYGNCDVPSVLVTREGYFGWQSKASLTSCQSGMHPLDLEYDIRDLGGPFYLNQSGIYTVHVGYGSNMTEESFNVASQERPNAIPIMYANGTYSGFAINYTVTGNNKLFNSTLADKTRAIILSTHATEDGNLTVTLPPDLVNMIEGGKKDSQFIVLDDGQEVVNVEQRLYFENMIMVIPFHSDTKKIEIIATEIV